MTSFAQALVDAAETAIDQVPNPWHSRDAAHAAVVAVLETLTGDHQSDCDRGDLCFCNACLGADSLRCIATEIRGQS